MSLRSPALLLLALAACGETSGNLVQFHAAAAGPADAVAGQPLVFTNARGWQVTLTRARLHVGALYLNQSVPTSGAQAQGCVLQGIYSGQVTEGMDVDTLSPDPQPFPADGVGTGDPDRTGEVWLFGRDPFATVDTTVLVDVDGIASSGGTDLPFSGQITIGQNRTVPASPALPGTNPLCKQRIVTPIPVSFSLSSGGTLLLRADPRAWFTNVDFAAIPVDPDDSSRRKFLDRTEGQADIAFYSGIRSITPYRFTWEP